MGFHRQPAAHVIEHAKGAPVVRFIAEQEIATVLAEQDPFRIANDCVDPAGHFPIAACGEVVCAHCGRIFWR